MDNYIAPGSIIILLLIDELVKLFSHALTDLFPQCDYDDSVTVRAPFRNFSQ